MYDKTERRFGVDSLKRLRLISDSNDWIGFVVASTGQRVTPVPTKEDSFYAVRVPGDFSSSGFYDDLEKLARKHAPLDAIAYFPVPAEKEVNDCRNGTPVGIQYSSRLEGI
jgi:hypothetical protein